jgi:hypothetical protein
LDEQFETTPVATFTAADVVGAGTTYTFIGTPGNTYYYKAVVKNGSEVLANTVGNFDSVTLRPAQLGYATFTTRVSGTTSYVHVQIPRNPPYSSNRNLIGLPLQIRYKPTTVASWNTPASVSDWADITTTVEPNPTAGLPDVGLEYEIPAAAGATFPALATSTSYDFQIRLRAGAGVIVNGPPYTNNTATIAIP